jgi:DNA-directed RNA polymerase specialized sigma24 family protein
VNHTAADVTALLRVHAAGSPDALEQLLPRVYDELRHIARSRLRRERPGHTLAATELVHEAFLKLVSVERVNWRDRAHFFAIASRDAQRPGRLSASASEALRSTS